MREFDLLDREMPIGELDDMLFADVGLCGCGYFEATVGTIYEYLKHKKDYGGENYKWEEWHKWEAEFVEEHKELLYEFFRYILDNRGFTEHGTSIGGAWITDKGKRLVKLLEESEV